MSLTAGFLRAAALGAVMIAAPVAPALASTWIPGHYAPNGVYIPGHWVGGAGPVAPYDGPPGPPPYGSHWVPGHYGPGGEWHPGHWAPN